MKYIQTILIVLLMISPLSIPLYMIHEENVEEERQQKVYKEIMTDLSSQMETEVKLLDNTLLLVSQRLKKITRDHCIKIHGKKSCDLSDKIYKKQNDNIFRKKTEL